MFVLFNLLGNIALALLTVPGIFSYFFESLGGIFNGQ